MEQLRERTEEVHEVSLVPSFRDMWRWWFKRVPLPVIRFNVINNGREFKSGKDDVVVIYDEQKKGKHFTHRIVPKEELKK